MTRLNVVSQVIIAKTRGSPITPVMMEPLTPEVTARPNPSFTEARWATTRVACSSCADLKR